MEDTELSSAREKALELLSYREHSEKELLDKLLVRKFPKALSLEVIRELKAMDLINDERFAASLVRQRIRSRPMGKSALVSLLRQKGLPRDAAGEVVVAAMAEEGVDERQLARRVFQRESRGKLPDAKALRRIGNLLLRRGFDRGLVRDLLSGSGEEETTGELEEDREEF